MPRKKTTAEKPASASKPAKNAKKAGKKAGNTLSKPDKRTMNVVSGEMYPDFSDALMLLADRMLETEDPQRKVVLKKWIERIEAVQLEIMKLQKLEHFQLKLSMQRKHED